MASPTMPPTPYPLRLDVYVNSGRIPAEMRRIRDHLPVDRGVTFFALGRLWPAVAGPATALFIAGFLDPDEQGFYYAFASLLALQTFFELSFSVALLPFVAQEWSHLVLGVGRVIEGPSEQQARLASLARLGVLWYVSVSVLFAVAVCVAGLLFLGGRSEQVNWHGPWVVLVLVAMLQLSLTPLLTILEGCNQIAPVYFARFLAAAAGSVSVWLVLLGGGRLWAACAATGAGVAVYAGLVFTYRRFFRGLLRGWSRSGVTWRLEFWPMQWRMAVSGGAAYFAFSLFVPVVFHYHGAIEAGRTGMTWQMTTVVGGLAQAWLTPRVPRLGMLTARQAYAELDQLFFRTSTLSVGTALVCAVSVVVFAQLLSLFDLPLGRRILPVGAVAMFAAATALMQITQCQAAYLRAHRREPLLVLSVASSLLIGVLVLILGARYGGQGTAAAYLMVVALMIVPGGSLIWIRRRREWHAVATLSAGGG